MARTRGRFTSIAAAAAMVSCGGETPPPALAPAASASAAPIATNSVEPPPAAPAAPAASTAAPELPRLPAPSPVARYTGFAKPESVLYDADNDRYLVSNINGNPDDKDNNGFISVLSPDGQVTNLKWIEGGKAKVKLDAPTGSAIAKGVLYVADLTTVRMFDLKTGAPKGEIAIPGTTLLNDVAAAPDGKVYVSDSGFKIGAIGNLEATSSDAMYVIEKGKAKALVKTTDLHMPNGIAWSDKGLVVCSSGAPEVFRLDEKGAKQDATTTAPGGRLDGLISLGDSLLVTSHEASAVLRGKLGGTFEVAIPEQKTPADIGYDTKRGRVLVPHVMADTVDVYELR
ncbi:SMP-30/gluconolactonase/LRE family protein [Sorangium sp. So ce590]|uniref:SMP-30/gluconolactonase/LRE family protein n=1 Tax=Sorangium sp. So ce590 TaxID=3133317 RepID=UPI003F5E2BEA